MADLIQASIEYKNDIGEDPILLYADEVLIKPAAMNARHVSDTAVYGLSLLGQEQLVRGFIARLRQNNQPTRLMLRITRNLVGTWTAPTFSNRARQLASDQGQTVVHAVCTPTVESNTRGTGVGSGQHLVFCRERDDLWALRRAIYRRLLTAYSTPLMPLERENQSDAERSDSRTWCRVIADDIMARPEHWCMLRGHPDRPNKHWHTVGLITMTEKQLDERIVWLTKKGALPFTIRGTHTATANGFAPPTIALTSN